MRVARGTREREREERESYTHSSSSNWTLMSCQPHRVTSGQSNSGHKQINISKLFSHMYQPSVKSVYKTNHFTNKMYIYIQTSDTNFQELVPSIFPLLKEHIRLGHAGSVDHSNLFIPGLRKTYKKGMDRHNREVWMSCIGVQ